MLRAALIFIVSLGVVGCSDNPQIVSAWATRSDKDAIIHVHIDSSDAQFIKRGQVYFSVVLNECGKTDRRFPMEPLIGGRRATDFDFIISQPTVEITSISPSAILDQYKTPCIMLEGGGYAGARLRSKQARLTLPK